MNKISVLVLLLVSFFLYGCGGDGISKREKKRQTNEINEIMKQFEEPETPAE